jgi:hypothetical protein
VKADVLALKYAQARYGLDAFVYDRLLEAGLKREEMSPKPRNFSKLHSAYGIAANEVLFIGTAHLRDLGYS